MACAVLGFLLAAVLSGAMNVAQVEGAPLTGWVTGTAMFFDASSSNGACGYGMLNSNTWPFGAVAALSPNSSLVLQSSPQAGCGICLEVKTPCSDSQDSCQSTSVVVTVTEACSSCTSTQLALNKASFSKIADVAAGQASVQYRQVECDVPGSINVVVLNYREADGGWLQLSPTQVAGSAAIDSVEIRQTPLAAGHLDMVASAWRLMRNAFGGVWEVSGIPAPPLDLRLTSGSQQIIARKALSEGGKLGLIPTSVNFAAGVNEVSEPATDSNIDSAAPTSTPTADVSPASPASSPAPASPASSLAPLPAPISPAPTASPNSSAGSPVPAPSSNSPAPATSTSSPALTPSPAPASPASSPAIIPSPAPTSPASSTTAVGASPVLNPATRQPSTSCNTTIMSIVEANPNLVTLAALIKSAGLTAALSDRDASLTLFAPTNAAVMKGINAGTTLKFNIDFLTRTLLNHIVPQKIDSSSFPNRLTRIETLNGGKLFAKKTSGKQLTLMGPAGSASTVRTDIGACNSVVHVINSLLMPDPSRRRG